MSDPCAATYRAAVADHGVSSEYSGVRVDNYSASYVGMPFSPFDGIAVLILFKAASAYGHSLIDLDPVADNGRFAYNYARAVIYAEIIDRKSVV